MYNTTITRSTGELTQDVYTFWLDDRTWTFKFQSFTKQARRTARSKFQTVTEWRRNSGQNRIEKPTVPADVAAEVKATFISMLTVEGE